MHDLYLRPDVRAAVVERLGRGILGADGEVDRKRWASARSATRRCWPSSRACFTRWSPRRSERFRREAEASGAAVAVHENAAPVRPWASRRYDRTVLISAPDEIRRARGPERFDRRNPSSCPMTEARVLADDVFVNDGDLAALDAWVADLVRRLAA